MRTFIRLILIFFATLQVDGTAHSGVFETIEVNKRTHTERSKGYFEIDVSEGSYGRINFTVHVKLNPLDSKVSTSLARIEIVEGGKSIGWIPTHRRDKQDGNGHFFNFELTPELAAKCFLVLVEVTGEVKGNVYRVDLYSYTKEGARQTRRLFDEIVKIEFPKNGYRYTLAQAAKGIKIEYKIVVEQDLNDVIPLPQGPSFAEPPGPSGLHPRERVSGDGQVYCLMDFGLAPPPKECVKTLQKGTYSHSFEWDGRNWGGPSDTGNPKGKPFPAGTYDMIVILHGFLVTENGKVPYEITRKTKLELK